MSKTILITGSNQGLGYQLVKTLLETAPEFKTIIMTARNRERGQQALKSLGENKKLDFHILNVTSKESIQETRDYVLHKYGHLDVLVNNAGVLLRSTENIHQDINPTLETNFYGPKNMTEAFLALLEPNGHVVQVSSRLGETSFLNNPKLSSKLLSPNLSIDEIVEIAEDFRKAGVNWAEKGWSLEGYGVYSVTKTLLNAYTRVLAKKLALTGSKIRVNNLNPGWARTNMGGNSATLSQEEGVQNMIPVVRDASGVTGKYWTNGAFKDFS